MLQREETQGQTQRRLRRGREQDGRSGSGAADGDGPESPSRDCATAHATPITRPPPQKEKARNAGIPKARP